MERDEDVASVFVFAMRLVDSLGAPFDRNAIMRQLQAVAFGEVSLWNSPAEEIAAKERAWGGEPLSPAERAEDLERLTRGRASMDAYNRLTAIRILRYLANDQRAA